MKPFLTSLLSILCFFEICAQQLIVLDSSKKISIRGLSVVNKKISWISGNKGTVGRSIDGGNKWEYFTVKGFEDRDFRDIEAFDRDNAVIIAVAEPAIILRTSDGGKSWSTTYNNPSKGMFLDALEFWNEQSGIVLGDPIDGKFFIARSFDGGRSWQEVPQANLPVADSGEACFAASGTNIRAMDLDEACFVTGGRRSRLFWKGNPIEIPIIQGKETTGANSIAVLDWKKRKGGKSLFIAGGDFASDTVSDKNSVYTNDGGKTWLTPEVPPFGYKSCVEFIDKKRLVACGTSGIDISSDGGRTWKNISRLSFHVVRKAKKGDVIMLAGSGGKIAMINWKE